MELTNNLKDNTIIITNYSNKLNILKELNNLDKLININFLTKEELLKKYYFSYDENAIYYLMNKYNLNIEVANIYLKNMYYIENRTYKAEKLNNLSNLKKELEDNNLLIKDNLFLDYIKNKNLVFYNYNSYTKLEKHLIENLKNYTNIEIINKEYKDYTHQVYEFNTIFEEIEYVAKEIIKLIEKNISIENIKLTNVNTDYYDIMTRIFSMYNLNLNLKDSKLISTKIAQEFLSLEGSLEEKITILSEKYKNNDILNLIIKIVNKYISFENKKVVKEMITYDFKNTYLPKEKYENTIEIVEYLNDYISDDNYVFMMSFNQNDVPKIHKDEEFITDNLKEGLLLDKVLEQNKTEKQNTINNIKNIKNLIITYKNTSPSGPYYPSNLILDLNLEVIKKELNYQESYSTISDKINLSKYIDNYLKTGEINPNLKLLYNSYNDIEYNTYNNKYHKIDQKLLKKYLNNSFNLSYSSMDSYYKCPFRYYLSHILKLDIYEERFEAYIGSLFHYVLEKSLKENKEIDYLIKEFITNNEKKLSTKEEFFIKKLSKELYFIHQTIKEHLENSNLKQMLFEERVTVEKTYQDVKVTFKGFIDKIMYEEKNNNTIVAIIDYKTGSADINLGYVPYGLSMQLPVYLYLAKNTNKLTNIKFAGFYLQKILSGPYNIDSKKTIEDQKRENLLLSGYSNNDEDILYEFDKTYKLSKYIKSMKLKNNGDFNSYAKTIDNEEIEKLIEITDQNIDNAIENIVNCNFDIKPKKTEKEVLGCKFCKYSDICFKEPKDEILIKEDKELSYLRSDIDA